MKKTLTFICIGLSYLSVHSQEINDAIRYTQENLNGTARFRAMGGAFGALGGDLSSLNVNPAGSSVFANNQASLSLSKADKKNKSNYFGKNTESSDSSFDLNQAGGVFVFNNKNQASKWKKFALGVNYEKTNLFDNTILSSGTNPNNSLSNYFLSYANAIPSTNQGGFYLNNVKNSFYEELIFNNQQAYLGITGNVIRPNILEDDNDSYTSNSVGGEYYQENLIQSSGYNGKMTFNFSTVFNDDLMIGINLNSHFVNFRQFSEFYERNDNNNPNSIQSAIFSNNLYTYGSGFSFQLGTIYKATKELRIGFSYESPTWYKLNDELNQKLITTGSNFIDYNNRGADNYPIINGTSSVSSDSDYTITYAPYILRTPSKLTGSLAYVFDKTGLISFDYIRKDYSTSIFKPDNDFSGINREMSSVLAAANEFRIGAEYKIKQWSLRGGYRFEESPYEDKKIMGDLNTVSGGLGYNFKSFKIDLAYTNSKRNASEPLFTQGFEDGANVNFKNKLITMTLLFEL